MSDPVPEALAATFTVNQTTDAADPAPADGVCDVDAVTAGNQCSLRAAIQTANGLTGSHTILLPAGTYTLTVTGQGEDAAATGDLDIAANITIRSSDIVPGTVTINGNATDRVFEVRTSRSLTAVGIIITNGNPGTGSGGAILSNGTLTLIGSTVSNSTTAATFVNGGGGGIAAVNGTTTLHATTVSGNSTPGGGTGGGILAGNSATVRLFTSTVSGNSVNAGYGGGIGSMGGTVELTDSTVDANSNPGGDGGGIFIIGGSLTANNVTVSNNTALGAGGRGGGLMMRPQVDPASVTLTNVTVTGNQANGGGGGLDLSESGGTATASLVHVTVGPNTAGNADGVYFEGANVTATAANSIFASDCDYTGSPSVTNLGGNSQAPGFVCPAIIPGAGGPNLVALADNGGFTRTHALGSPSEAGDAGAAMYCAVNDQRGLPRAGQGATCDAGAFEVKLAGNGPPIISAIPNQTYNEDGVGGPIVVRFADSDTPGATGMDIAMGGFPNPPIVAFDANVGTGGVGYIVPGAGVDLNGSGTVTVGVEDASTATTTTTFTLTVNAVNDAPIYSALGGNPPASNEDAGLQSVPGFATGAATGPTTAVIFDENAQTLTGYTATVTGTTGTLAFASAPAVDGFGALTYQASPDTFGTATVSLTLADNGGTANGGVDVSAAQTFTITVDGLNDAPQFTLGGNPPASSEDAGPQVVVGFATGVRPGPLTASDETGQSLTFTPTIVSTTGGLTFTSAPVVNEGTGNLFYTAAPGSSGTATVDLTLTDNGSGVAPNVNVSGVQTFVITVGAVNNPPVNTVPGPQTTPANTPLVFSTANGNAISITDADAGAATNLMMILFVPVPTGTLSLGPAGSMPALTSATGSGSNLLNLAGSVTTLNSALQGLTFTPQAGVTGITTLTIATTDTGNSGGPAQWDVDTVQINVGNLPALSINDPATVAEGNSGTPNSVVFIVTLAPASNLTVSVPYTTADGTAAGGASCTGSADFQTTAGTLTFAPTETSKTVTVPVCGDFVIEGNETLRVDLGTPVNAVVADGQGAGTIQNDDVAGTISFTAATASAQENGGTVTLTVQRTGGAASGITVQYGTGDVTAQSGADYTNTTGTLTFGAGESSKSVTVPIRDDGDTELAETFTVTLANPQGGATLGTPTVATVTITDTSVPASPLQGQDDTDASRKNTRDSKDVKETDEERLQRERTNRSNRDDIATEGNVTEVHLDATPPYVVMGNRDGAVRINLLCGDQCPVIRVGDYIEVDGVKQHEQLYDAEQVTVRK